MKFCCKNGCKGRPFIYIDVKLKKRNIELIEYDRVDMQFWKLLKRGNYGLRLSPLYGLLFKYVNIFIGDQQICEPQNDRLIESRQIKS